MIFDIKSGKIPNRLICIALVIGLSISFSLNGIDGLLEGIVGCLIPILGLLILFEFRVLGAGDIKLFGALGTVAGFSIIWIICVSFIVGAVEACLVLIIKKFKGQNMYGLTRVCFTVPIMVAVLIVCVVSYLKDSLFWVM